MSTTGELNSVPSAMGQTLRVARCDGRASGLTPGTFNLPDEAGKAVGKGLRNIVLVPEPSPDFR
jgi:hypothetical protein